MYNFNLIVLLFVLLSFYFPFYLVFITSSHYPFLFAFQSGAVFVDICTDDGIFSEKLVFIIFKINFCF